MRKHLTSEEALKYFQELSENDSGDESSSKEDSIDEDYVPEKGSSNEDSDNCSVEISNNVQTRRKIVEESKGRKRICNVKCNDDGAKSRKAASNETRCHEVQLLTSTEGK